MTKNIGNARIRRNLSTEERFHGAFHPPEAFRCLRASRTNSADDSRRWPYAQTYKRSVRDCSRRRGPVKVRLLRVNVRGGPPGWARESSHPGAITVESVWKFLFALSAYLFYRALLPCHGFPTARPVSVIRWLSSPAFRRPRRRCSSRDGSCLLCIVREVTDLPCVLRSIRNTNWLHRQKICLLEAGRHSCEWLFFFN